ncbi:aldo/keto reductase [Phenylobacterium sp.]|jgi:aryl-alcohol dehydrogenase-like predicted oxidoreductase|uniref:aldo/keto reductase n=1 Tax=Phenylobacterium sp. TaxID=1871053 RepID=UPI003784FB22
MDATRRQLVATAAAAALTPTLAMGQAVGLITKPIPSSGERLPVVGVGTARRYEAAPSEAERKPLRDTLQRFHQLGGKVIDTAPSYGDAEAIVGGLIADLGVRSALFLATKVGADDKAAGQAQIEDSFRKLRTDRIDLFSVHNLRDTANQLATLRDLKAAGRIRYVGATTSFDQQYADFEAMMRRETLDVIQIDYALDNRGSADRILPLALERRMGVMVNLPFGRSRLFQATQGKPLPDWAAEIDCTTWAQVFLKYVVSHPAVICAVPGMAQARYVDDNLGAARGRLPDAALRRRMEQYIDSI